MVAEKLERPVGICPRCRAVVRSYDEIDKKCARPLAYATRCPGVIRSAVAKDEWSECPSCHATGYADGSTCMRCSGTGWIFTEH